MKLYAERPGRLVTQVLGDLTVLVVVWVAVRLGRATQDRVDALAAPGRDAEATALRLDGQLRESARDVDDAPLVGGVLAAPLRTLAGTSRELASSAQDYQDAVARVALLSAVMVFAVPVLVALAVWLPRRVAWVVAASAASRLMRAGSGASELLAVRALARQSLPTLARLGPGVVAGWRAGDATSTARLADLELKSLGLRHRVIRAGPGEQSRAVTASRFGREER